MRFFRIFCAFICLKEDYTRPEHTYRCIWLLADCFRDLDSIVHRVTKVALHPQWEEPFNQLKSHWSKFTSLYTLIHPPKRQNWQLTFPKLHSILDIIPQYIRENKHSLFRAHEQAFETLHQDYKTFERRFKVTVTGYIELQKDEEKSPPPRPRTRSQAKKRKLSPSQQKAFDREQLVKSLLSLAPQQLSESVTNPTNGRIPFGNFKKAQKKRIRALSAYAASKFPPSSHNRLIVAAKYALAADVSVAPWNCCVNVCECVTGCQCTCDCDCVGQK